MMMMQDKNRSEVNGIGPPAAMGDNTVSEPSPQPPNSLPPTQVAHDLNNVLSGIRMMIQGLSFALPEQSVARSQFASLELAARHAGELCCQLQQSLRGGKVASHVDRVDLSAVIEDMKGLLEAMVRPKSHLELQLAADLPRVLASSTQLQQITLDLLTNASDALPDGQGSITIRTGIVAEVEQRRHAPVVGDGSIPGEGRVYLEVEDTGQGISEDDLPRIFEPTFTTKTDGQGLGLASVRQLVSNLGGTVTIQSRMGEGTCVRCVFPSAKRAIDGRPDDGKKVQLDHGDGAADSRGSDLGRVTVLLVEDTPGLLHLTKTLLEKDRRLETVVMTATNGREAIELLGARRDVSAVVLDAMLPDCRGTQLIRRMRELAPDVSIILASGLPPDQLAPESDESEPDALLTKPFDGDGLVEKLVEVLRAPVGPDGRPGARA